MKAAIESVRSKIAARFGKNKTEELCRLLYEIGRRESMDPNAVLDQAIGQFPSDGSPNDALFQAIPFARIKKMLLKRRYPNFPEVDFKRVYLAPLNLNHEKTEAFDQTQHAFEPSQIFIENRARDYPIAKRVLRHWKDVPTFEINSLNELRKPKKEWMSDFGKRTIAVSIEPFDLVKPCPCSSSTVSCNYYLLNIGYGCPFDCSYCYLQDYQNLPAIVLPANVEAFLTQTNAVLQKNPKQFTRIGTGEYADSLALDWLTEYSKILVPFFADKSVTLELKTKSDCIENLIGLRHGGKTVIAWSLNPARFASEEKGTAPVLKRLEAARSCEEAGYGTAFHFDPLLQVPGWESDYKNLVAQLFSHVNRSLRWVSLGSLRFHKDLRRVAEFRHPESEIFLAEERLDPVDEKMRYATESRIEMYQKMVTWIREYSKTVPIYLCMESPRVWKSVFEGKPYEGRIDEWISSCGSAAGR